MKVTFILPTAADLASPDPGAETQHRPARSPVCFALFARELAAGDEITWLDEPRGKSAPAAREPAPDLVVAHVRHASAGRTYDIADHYRWRGAHVCLGGPRVASLPEEAAWHAQTIFVGSGVDAWRRFLTDLRCGRPKERYVSHTRSSALPSRGHARRRARNQLSSFFNSTQSW